MSSVGFMVGRARVSSVGFVVGASSGEQSRAHGGGELERLEQG